VGAIGRTGPVASDSSEIHFKPRPVMSDSSGDVGLVCGMKRGIPERFMMCDTSLGSVELLNLVMI
jgi:hypothetical protein